MVIGRYLPAFRAIVAALVAAGTILGGTACSEHANLPDDHAPAFLARFVVDGFDQTAVVNFRRNAAEGFYFGPSSADPVRDVHSPTTLVVPPTKDQSDAVYATLADGRGPAADGVECYAAVHRSQSGGPVLDAWQLTADQVALLKAGDHVVLSIDVECG